MGVVIVLVVLIVVVVFGVGGYFVWKSLQKADYSPKETSTIKTAASTTKAPNNETKDLFMPNVGKLDADYELVEPQPSLSGQTLYNTGVGCIEWNKHYEPLTISKTPCTTKWNYEPTGALRTSKDGNTGRLYLGTGTGGFSVITGVEDNPLYWMSDESKWELLKKKTYSEYMIRNRGTKNCLTNKNGTPTVGSCDPLGASTWNFSP